MSTLVTFSDVSSSEEEWQPPLLSSHINLLNFNDEDSESWSLENSETPSEANSETQFQTTMHSFLPQTTIYTSNNRNVGELQSKCARLCSSRPWCSSETRKAATQLILLCITSCSWTLLFISLTLTRPQPHAYRRSVIESTAAPPWAGNTAEACENCLSINGPPKAYFQAFGKPLQQIAEIIDGLDRPLAPSGLRVHLAGTRALLNRLAQVLHMPLTTKGEDERVLGKSDEAIKTEVKPLSSGLACPEQYLGTRAGYPRYKIGFVPITCPSRPVTESVTLLLWDIKQEYVPIVLMDVWKLYPGLKVLLVSAHNTQFGKSLMVDAPHPSLSAAVRRLLQRVTTPYVLLAQDLTSFTNHTRLERLLWVMEETGLWAVGGSVKGTDGRWRAGCLQTDNAAGQLLYSRGYTTSIHECQLCNALETPTLIRSKSLMKIQWPKEFIPDQLIMPDLFLNIHRDGKNYGYGVATCPDAMFELSKLEPIWVGVNPLLKDVERISQDVKAHWEKLARIYILNLIQLPSKDIFHYSCEFLHPRLTSKFNESEITPIPQTAPLWQCIKTNTGKLLTVIVKVCTDLDILCFLNNEDAHAVLANGRADIWGFQQERKLQLQVKELTSLIFLYSSLSNYTLIQSQLPDNIQHNISFDGSVICVFDKWWTITISVRDTSSETLWLKIHVLDTVLWVPHLDSPVYRRRSRRSTSSQVQLKSNLDTENLMINGI